MRRVAPIVCVVLALSGVVTPSGAQTPERRAVAVVVELERPPGTDPLFDANGESADDAAATVDTLRRDVDELLAVADVPFALKLSPVLCDQLRLLGTQAAQTLRMRVDRLARAHPPLAVPYTDVRFADRSPDAFAQELAEGERALDACTDTDTLDALMTSDLGVPDARMRDVLADEGPRFVLSSYAFPPAADPDEPLYAIPATIAGDEPIASLVAERPGAGGLVIVAGQDVGADLIEDLAAEERIVLEPLSALLEPSLDFRDGPLYEPEPLSPRYEQALLAPGDALDDLRSYTLPDNTLATIFGTTLAEYGASADPNVRAGSTERAQLARLAASIRKQFELVSLADGSVTFTSRRGAVPVTVSNRAPYPVKVRVSLQSSKLAFPEGRTIVRRIDPPGGTVTFDALARSSGTFPLTAVLKSPSGQITLDTAEFTVRSAAANLPVLILTVAGAILLLALSAGRAGRRRRGSS